MAVNLHNNNINTDNLENRTAKRSFFCALTKLLIHQSSKNFQSLPNYLNPDYDNSQEWLNFTRRFSILKFKRKHDKIWVLAGTFLKNPKNKGKQSHILALSSTIIEVVMSNIIVSNKKIPYCKV